MCLHHFSIALGPKSEGVRGDAVEAGRTAVQNAINFFSYHQDVVCAVPSLRPVRALLVAIVGVLLVVGACGMVAGLAGHCCCSCCSLVAIVTLSLTMGVTVVALRVSKSSNVSSSSPAVDCSTQLY